MKQVTPINSAPRPLDWPAANKAIADGHPAWHVLCVLLGGDSPATEEAAILFYAQAAAQQRSPATSIYDRMYTAHIYPEPGVAMGQVYEALRDYSAQNATPDPAMVEIRNRGILELLDKWQAEGPPSPEDVEFWRQFDADLARAKRGADAPAAVELEQKLERVQTLLEQWSANLPDNNFQAREQLAEALG